MATRRAVLLLIQLHLARSFNAPSQGPRVERWTSRPKSLGSLLKDDSAGDFPVYEVKLPKPLGITIENIRGDIVIVGAKGNAAEAGVASGDALIGLGSFFGDAIWAVPKGPEAIIDIEAHIFNCDNEVTLQLARGGGRAAEAALASRAAAMLDERQSSERIFVAGASEAELNEIWE